MTKKEPLDWVYGISGFGFQIEIAKINEFKPYTL